MSSSFIIIRHCIIEFINSLSFSKVSLSISFHFIACLHFLPFNFSLWDFWNWTELNWIELHWTDLSWFFELKSSEKHWTYWIQDKSSSSGSVYFVWILAEVSLVLACCWIVLNDVLYLVYAARPQRSERYWVQWGWVSVKSCTLFCIPIEALRLTEQTAGRLRQMGRAYWSAILLSGLVGAFWGNVHFCRAYVYLYECVSMCVWYLRYGWWTRTNCSFSFTHHWTALFYSQEQEYTPSLYLPHKVWYMRLSFTVFQKHT